MIRRLLAVVVVALSVAAPSAASAMADPAQPPTIHWSRDKKEPRWVDGYTVVDTPPDAVWTALQRVPSWPTMFSDIKTMKVKRQEGSSWRLEMSTQTFDCGSQRLRRPLPRRTLRQHSDQRARRRRGRVRARASGSEARAVVHPLRSVCRCHGRRGLARLGEGVAPEAGEHGGSVSERSASRLHANTSEAVTRTRPLLAHPLR